jgi:phosphoglycolate phosphatase
MEITELEKQLVMEKGIIFDLDGTLWDSCEQVIPAWNRVLKRYNN